MHCGSAELMRLELDYNNSSKPWTLHSVYKFDGMAGGLVQASYAAGPSGEADTTTGTPVNTMAPCTWSGAASCKC
jgi:hypothetical protein